MENKRNCNTCKLSMFERCDTLKNNAEYQAIQDEGFLDIGKFKFKENFICDSYNSLYIEYPIQVSKINSDTDTKGLRDKKIGKFAKIRPCGEEHKGKTYLGIYLGDLPIGHSISYKHDSKELNVSYSTNPAIFVFDLNKIIYGCESWWGLIEKEKDLKSITNSDIDNVWYVKALNELSKE